MTWDETMFEIVHEIRSRGLFESVYVGGCCKTSAADLAKLRVSLDRA